MRAIQGLLSDIFSISMAEAVTNALDTCLWTISCAVVRVDYDETSPVTNPSTMLLTGHYLAGVCITTHKSDTQMFASLNGDVNVLFGEHIALAVATIM